MHVSKLERIQRIATEKALNLEDLPNEEILKRNATDNIKEKRSCITNLVQFY